MNLRTPICDLFEIEHPIFLAGMGQVAYAEVCAAVSEAGGYGTLGMAGATPEAIRDEMREVRRRTDKPFGVDLLAALPDSVLAAIDVIIDEGAGPLFLRSLVPQGPEQPLAQRPRAQRGPADPDDDEVLETSRQAIGELPHASQPIEVVR